MPNPKGRPHRFERLYGTDYYTTGEIAELLGCTTQKARRWIEHGQIEASRKEGGQYRIPKSVFDPLLSYYKKRMREGEKG